MTEAGFEPATCGLTSPLLYQLSYSAGGGKNTAKGLIVYRTYSIHLCISLLFITGMTRDRSCLNNSPLPRYIYFKELSLVSAYLTERLSRHLAEGYGILIKLSKRPVLISPAFGGGTGFPRRDEKFSFLNRLN